MGIIRKHRKLQHICKMKKSVLMCSMIVILMVMVMMVEGKSKLVSDICAKCSYCETDPDCGGCARCGDCKTRKDYGCRFCRKGEEEEKCVERCSKGCRICKKLESCKTKNNSTIIEDNN